MKTKMTLRRVLSVLLCVVMIVSLMPTALAAGVMITGQPEDVIAFVGERAEFTVTAEGTDLTYQWQMRVADGNEWINLDANQATHSVIANMAINNAQFRCVVTDAKGNQSMTKPAFLTVVDNAVTITKHPTDVSVDEGKTAMFAVTATGAGLTYQWQYNAHKGKGWQNSSSMTKGYNTDTLYVEATDARNGYSYRCVVTDASGNTVTSNAAALTVTAVLGITRQPADITVKEGETASFKVTATGTGLTYQWQYKGASATTWKDCSSTTEGYNTDTLKPIGTAARNGYNYRCKVTDANGNTVTSDAAALTVIAVLGITKQPADITVIEGETASFKVTATGTGLTYQWQYKGASGTTWKNCTSTTEGYNAATLKPVGTAARNGYNYRCKVTDVTGKTVTSNAAALTVIAALGITKQPADITVKEGETAKFAVTATGTGLTYQWQFKGASGTTWKNCTSTTEGYNAATLKPVGTMNRNGYSYRCIITDVTGNKITSDAAALTVIAPLTITKQPADITVIEGETASFKVTATGTGLTYQWQFKGASATTWKDCTSTTEGYNAATLKPVGTMNRNGYSYRCIITDVTGNKVTSDAAKLTVIEVLVITKQPVDITVKEGETAKFAVTATGTGLTYQWQYKTASAATWKNCTSTTEGYNAAELKPVGTMSRNGYSYRCVITDVSGNKVTSDAAALTVIAALVITQQPVDITVKEGETAKFAVTATGTGLTYQWQYKTASGATWKNCTSTTEGYNAAELKPVGTMSRNGYSYRCVITDANGNKVTSDAATLTVIAPLTITQQPQSVYANVGDDVSFTVEVEGGTEPYTYQWQARYTPTSISGYVNWFDLIYEEGINTQTLRIQVSPADIPAKYQFRCVITDADGNTVTSEPARVFQALTITQQPQSVYANVGDDVSFTVEVEGGTEPYTYQWQERYYSRSIGGYVNWSDMIYEEGINTQTLRTQVTPADVPAKYQFRCVITDADGNTVISEPASVLEKAALTITQQPQDVYTNVDEKVTFTVAVTGGTEPYTYKWQAQRSIYVDEVWYGISAGAKPDSLTITATKWDFANKYQFRCVITDADGNTVTSEPARVLQALTITQQPQDAYAEPGDDVSFTVEFSGGKEPYTYQWQFRYKDNGTYGNWYDCSNRTWFSGYDTDNMYVRVMYVRVDQSDIDKETQYRCIITDANGNTLTSDPARIYQE